MGAILSYPDLTLTGTLTGTGWQNAYPLSNLYDSLFSVKTRSSDASGTRIIYNDLGSAKAIRTLALFSHNLSFAATIRVRGYSDSAYTLMVTGADTGTVYIYPQTLTLNQAIDYPDHWIFAFTSSKTARYWKLEIIDTTNVLGWIEFGRFWVGEAALAPGVSISYGASLIYEPRDIINEAIGGAIWGFTKESRRIATITFAFLEGMEKQQALILQKNLGKTGELLYVKSDLDSAIDMIIESFPATIRQTSPLGYNNYKANDMPIELQEIIDNSNIVYLVGGRAADVLARQ